MFGKFKAWWIDWYNDWTPEASVRDELYRRTIVISLERARFLSVVFSIVAVLYGITSLSFLQRYDSSITWYNNLLPRIILNALPFFTVGRFIRNSKASGPTKLLVWSICFSFVLTAASAIAAWPIALNGNPEVLAYPNAACIYVFSVGFLALSPPNRFIPIFTIIISGVFLIPTATVAYLSGDSVAFFGNLSNGILALGMTVVFASLFNKKRVYYAKIELQKSNVAKSFLQPMVRDAIFNNRQDLLGERTKFGFVLALDLRGYTKLVTTHDKKSIAQFIEAYEELITRSITKYGGVLHKSMGDGHLVSFGLNFEIPNVDELSDERIQNEVTVVRTELAKCAYEFFESVCLRTNEIAKESRLAAPIAISAGLDFGEVDLKVVGSEGHTFHLDVYGQTIIRACRLESHSKSLPLEHTENACVMVSSPSAAMFLTDVSLKKISTSESPVRNFPELTEVFVASFAFKTADDLARSA